MCNRAEQFARKLYTPWSEDGMSRKDNTEVIEACIKGYEQAEKDVWERIEKYLSKRDSSDFATVGWILKNIDECKKKIMED